MMAARSSVVRSLVHLLVLVTVAGLFVSACTAHRLSQAQDAFSKAAEQENRLVLLDKATLSAYASPYNLYLEADTILTKDTAAKTSDLKGDKLLGTAYALHALTLWRLTDLSTIVPAETLEANATKTAPPPPKPATVSDGFRLRAREAKGKALDAELQDQLGPRDRTMMMILPNLMDHDTGMQQLADGHWSRAHDFFESAFAGVDGAIAGVPKNHDVRAYLYMVEIQTLVAWRSAVANAPPRELSPDAKEACRTTWFIPKLNTAITEIGKVSTIRGGDDVWSSAFVVSRLQAAGLDVATVRDNTIQAASTCEWRK